MGPSLKLAELLWAELPGMYAIGESFQFQMVDSDIKLYQGDWMNIKKKNPNLADVFEIGFF